ncbi:division abnormally delayed protein [Aricia agestis]|uniref:division abnormally delayed protein n=1 Tax=Aricia agestis TaxID=91739 RepID=UPI001C2092AF|nr:division abnormally delayed protein [Aricia agestis]
MSAHRCRCTRAAPGYTTRVSDTVTMKCSVVVLMLACLRLASSASTSCTLAEDFFTRHNISADDSNEPGPICGGQCCGRGREAHLRNYVRKSAEDRVCAASRPVAELLLATKRTLQEHLTALSHQSQNKTAVLFTHIYKNHAIRAHAPLGSLYDDIRILLRSTGEDHDLGSPPPKDMATSAKKFFKDIFPVAYQNILKLESKQFTQEYEACLKDAYNGVQPFGDVPEQLGSSLSRSLESARALLQVLAVGAGALLDSQQILSSMSSECASRLLQVGGCARCRNHQASPCRNYCLNVARGCIGSLLSELDAPWAGYVEGVERVARADADAALRTLDSRVSEAIMHALENHVILEKKVRQECGPPTTVEVAMLTTPRPTGSRRDPLRAPPPDAELLQFAATLASSRSLFADIADTVCDDPELVYDGNDRCWNGEAVGEYTKALVASASVSDQKYNPEVPAAAAQDARVAALGDKLRQARQLLVSHSYKSSADSFMLGDEAGDEGSGSGRSYTDDDAAYDAEGSGEEGSGAVDIGTRTMIGEDTTYSAPPVAGSAANFRPLQFIFGITIVIWLT